MPGFTKNSEACKKKWSAIYNDYKGDKAVNLKSGLQWSEKCCWFQLVNESMFDKANVITHTHSNARNVNGLMSTATLDTNTTEPILRL